MRSNPRAKVLTAVGVAAVVLAGLLVAIDHGSGSAPLTVDVFAKQYSWSFGYPGNGNAFSGEELHVPLGREVEFKMYSRDVHHGFWVPEWKINEDIPPGKSTTASVTPEKAGTYQLICSELCGIEHAYMRAKVVVEPPAEFEEWVGGLKRKIPPHWTELMRLDAELESIH